MADSLEAIQAKEGSPQFEEEPDSPKLEEEARRFGHQPGKHHFLHLSRIQEVGLPSV